MIIPDNEKEHLKKHFAELTGDVELIVFSQELECQSCKEAKEEVLELGTLSPKIKTKVYDFVKDGDEDIKYGIKKIPAIAIVGKSDYGIRYYGVPAGYEFAVITEDIIDVSRGTTLLPDYIKKKLAMIKNRYIYRYLLHPHALTVRELQGLRINSQSRAGS
jgi:alkyl hydroperoxide reductase subunit AhpF